MVTRSQNHTGNEVVVLVHGFAAPRVVMNPLARHLEEAGYQTVNWGYASLFRSIESHGEQLRSQLQEIEHDPAVERLHLVTHSMGGIVARQALSEERPEKLGRIVMLAPPNRGSFMAPYLAPWLGKIFHPITQLTTAAESYVNQLPIPQDLEIGVIAASLDWLVAVESSRLPKLADHLVLPTLHGTILFRQDVHDHVTAFLREGHFARTSAAAVS